MGTPDRTEHLADQLAVALVEALGTVEVRGLTRLTGGASRETWSFDAVDADGTVHELVLRRDPPGRPGPPGSMALEADAIRLAGTAGVPVPEVLTSRDDPAAWGSAGMVMRRLPGEALGKRVLRDDSLAAARGRLVEQFASALAALHSVDPDLLVGAPQMDPLDTMRSLIDAFGEPVPTFEFALRWLEQRRPSGGTRAIVHGDFRLGNLLVDPDGLRGVLDWELVHLGDPVEDLGWCCVRAWRFGAPDPVAGLGDREQLLEAYAAAGGRRVGLDELLWWEAYGTLRWGVICLMQVSAHLRGDLRSVELAAIGRRVCETEWDLLLLLAPEAAAAALVDGEGRRSVAGSDPPPPGLHGRPTAPELVEAVRELLEDRIVPGVEGALSYHARVAAKVLGVVERELRQGSRPLELRALALARLGVADEAELCTALRSGDLDVTDPRVVQVLAEGVAARARVANPGYLG